MQTKSLAAAFLRRKPPGGSMFPTMTINKQNKKQAESCSSRVTNRRGSAKEMQQ